MSLGPFAVPDYFRERRNRRTFKLINGNSNTPGYANRGTAGAAMAFGLPLWGIRTGAAGANKRAAWYLDPGAAFTANDIDRAPDAPGIWSRPHYVHALMLSDTFAPPAHATATTFAGCEFAGNALLPPYAAPPAVFASQTTYGVRARCDTGAWELYQVDTNIAVASRSDPLVGVLPFTTDPGSGFRIEIWYEPGLAITAAINGVVGVRAPALIVPAGQIPLNEGLGMFAESGSDALGQNGIQYTDVYADVIGHP